MRTAETPTPTRNNNSKHTNSNAQQQYAYSKNTKRHMMTVQVTSIEAVAAERKHSKIVAEKRHTTRDIYNTEQRKHKTCKTQTGAAGAMCLRHHATARACSSLMSGLVSRQSEFGDVHQMSARKWKRAARRGVVRKVQLQQSAGHAGALPKVGGGRPCGEGEARGGRAGREVAPGTGVVR